MESDAVGVASVCAGAGPAQQISPTTDALARNLTNPIAFRKLLFSLRRAAGTIRHPASLGESG